MRTMLRSAVIAAASSCALLAACRSGPVPHQVLTRSAPANVAAPIMAAPGPWVYRPSMKQQHFLLDQRAVLSIRADTSVRADTVSSHTEVAFTAAPAAIGISGTVAAFLVQSAGRGATVPAGLAIPFPFRGEYSTRASQLEFSSPREVVQCESTSLAVAQSLRDLWFRPPDTLRVGTTWEDSSSYVLCRDGIPLGAMVHRRFRVSGTTERAGRLLLTVSRTSRTVIEGTGAQFGEAVGVTGAGSGQLAYEFDPQNGEVVSASGDATLDLSLRSRLRTQVVRQAVEIRLGRP